MTKRYPVETQGRRRRRRAEVTTPGDYFLEKDEKTLWFLLPIARDEDAPPEARSIHRITSPPWTFEVHPDKSVEVGPQVGRMNSIAARRQDGQGNVWHGYLIRGNVWRETGP